MKLLTPDNFTVNDCYSLLTGLESYLEDISIFEAGEGYKDSPRDCGFVVLVGLYDYLRPHQCLRVYDRFYTYNKIAGNIPDTVEFKIAVNQTYNKDDYPDVVAYKDKERMTFVKAAINTLKKFIKEE